mmetsp:Transcript_69238/g.225524  ORF Transcript_69238/g.225524 Transcript_69238/m.225524 type:complete len:516 (-) Transcript_69238:141-1688(-)
MMARRQSSLTVVFSWILAVFSACLASLLCCRGSTTAHAFLAAWPADRTWGSTAFHGPLRALSFGAGETGTFAGDHVRSPLQTLLGFSSSAVALASAAVAAAAVGRRSAGAQGRPSRWYGCLSQLRPRLGLRRASPAAVIETAPVWEKGVLPPIWVVNLDQSPDRWAQSCEEFATQSIKLVRWPATYGKFLSEDELKEKATWAARYFCTPGMVGCFCSHRGIWQEMVAKNIPCVIVLEDDVIPYENFSENVATLQTELEALEDGWDVCLLGAIGCINPDKEKFYMRFYELGPGGGRPCPKGSSTRTLSDHLFVPHRPAGTHAYMISLKGARKLVERFPKARYHVDLAAWGVSHLKLVASNPFLATQRFDEGAESTVAKGGSATERFMSWAWKASGLTTIARSGGLTNPSWAWRTPIFALPVPWQKWPARVKQVSLGPFTSVLIMLFTAGLALRSPTWIGGGFAYLAVMSSFIRFLCGTFSVRVFVVEAMLSAFFVFWGCTGRGPAQLLQPLISKIL